MSITKINMNRKSFDILKTIIKDICEGKRRIEINENSIFIHETEEEKHWLEITENSIEIEEFDLDHTDDEF